MKRAIEGAELEWPPLHGATPERVWRDVLQPIAGILRQSSAAVAADLVTLVRGEVPELFVDAQTVDEAMSSTEESVRLFAQLLEVGGNPAQSDLPPSTLAIMRSAVWRQIPLSWHSRFYRLAQQHVWRWLHSHIVDQTPDGSDRALAVDLATTMLLQFVDRAMTLADEAYEIEREKWLQGAAASRGAAIDDVLADRDQDVTSLSTRLRYDLTRHHVGVIVWSDNWSHASTSLPALSEAVAEIARANGAESSITHPLGSLAVAGWFSSRRDFGPDLEFSLDKKGSPVLPEGVKVAAGVSGHGIDGFRLTHTQAGHARSVAALLPPEDVDVTRYQDVAVIALCAADPEHATRFVRQELGSLAADDEATFRLAKTLQIYLRENRSRARAAAVLSVHPNTVNYRVRQAEELLGRSIDENSLELGVALTMLPALKRLDATRSSGV
ncbi:helix-turn-helix domain-containing protein [Aeromicrobium panaciterrae]|uniref:PucR family transcriptional regulator n=1 Tax=Aeromicrobium panaciterrae TaxID=363861 RepID=UPI0031D01DAB